MRPGRRSLPLMRVIGPAGAAKGEDLSTGGFTWRFGMPPHAGRLAHWEAPFIVVGRAFAHGQIVTFSTTGRTTITNHGSASAGTTSVTVAVGSQANMIIPSATNLVLALPGMRVQATQAAADAALLWAAADLILGDPAADSLGYPQYAMDIGEKRWPLTAAGAIVDNIIEQADGDVLAYGALERGSSLRASLLAAALASGFAATDVYPSPNPKPRAIALSMLGGSRYRSGGVTLDPGVREAATYCLDLGYTHALRTGPSDVGDEQLFWRPVSQVAIGGSWYLIGRDATSASVGTSSDDLSETEAGVSLPIVGLSAAVGPAVAWRLRGWNEAAANYTTVTQPTHSFNLAIQAW